MIDAARDRQDEARRAPDQLRARRARRRGATSPPRSTRGKVAGAAIDVFVEEPARENPLFGRDNVVATPHLGAATTEAQENVAVQIAEQMADFLLTGAVSNAVNMPSLTAEEATRLRPYMKLAEQLGSFAGQLTETGIHAVDDRIRGRDRRAQCQAADRDRADRVARAAARHGQHGQRAGDLPRARHPRQRDARAEPATTRP